MNCVKCPIVEECGEAKITTQAVHTGGSPIPVVMEPYNKDDCPLIQLVKESESKSPK